MEKIILNCNLPPGDVLMLTAAVRDLHRCYPGKFLTDVRTNYPELWDNNPYITKLKETSPFVRTIHCSYPLVKKANLVPTHFLLGYIEFLNKQLNLRIEATEFKADIHLSEKELSGPSPIQERVGNEPYWIIVSGGKRDFTIKWWDHSRFQKIVDHFQSKIQFVQTGAPGHYHPELDGVIDFRGKTSMREMICLMHNASGVICPVTFTMHLSAAVPMKIPYRLRPTVVIAGGREPVHWESYPGHHFLHTIGMLPCCRMGGCWRARTKPLRDNSHFNQSEHLCVDVVNELPRCMDMITAEEVINKVTQILIGEERYQDIIHSEMEKMELEGRVSDQVGRINMPNLALKGASFNNNGKIKDLLVNHYRKVPKSFKKPLYDDLSNHALTNTPQGLGDTLLLTQLPYVAKLQGKTRYIDSKSSFFKPLMKYNDHYVPAGDRTQISANVLQYKYDIGNGHFIQRLQRAFGLDPVLVPKGHLDLRTKPNTKKVILHFDAGSAHAAWQRIYVHPRARQLYPESQVIIQNFIDNHKEFSFYQIGNPPVLFKNINDATGQSLDETIELMRQAEYFIGIISGPMHLATALGLKCIVILNFPHAHEILLPTLRDVDLIESEWLYPQNVHLHQESDGPLVRRLNLQSLEMSFNGDVYPFWNYDYLPLVYDSF